MDFYSNKRKIKVLSKHFSNPIHVSQSLRFFSVPYQTEHGKECVCVFSAEYKGHREQLGGITAYRPQVQTRPGMNLGFTPYQLLFASPFCSFPMPPFFISEVVITERLTWESLGPVLGPCLTPYSINHNCCYH